MRTPELLPIQFVIVGGSMTGLSSAIALSRAGHTVTVLDDAESTDHTSFAGGCRIPPNGSKLLYRWGMTKRLQECAIRSKGTLFAQFDSGSIVGSHEWEEEVLEETGGDMLLVHFGDLRRILAECAREHGATIRSGSHVVDVHADPQRPSVTLATGEVFTADVVVAADGCYMGNYFIRNRIIEALEQPHDENPLGMQLFHTVLKESAFDKLDDPEMMSRLKQHGRVFTWFGQTYGAFGFPMKEPGTGNGLFALFVYVERKADDTTPLYAKPEDLVQHLSNCDPRLATLAKEAFQCVCVPMVERPTLEEWLHPGGRILAIGDAAHPLPPGSLYSIGLSIGDAAVLGRLFSHLHAREQIDDFLRAVQDVRESRVERVMRACMGNIFAVSLPPGIAEARDRGMRERAERGIENLKKNLATGGAETSEEMVQAIEGIFAYDPEDEADDWWVQWGLMKERGTWEYEPSVVVTVDVQQHES